jgi:hypothetical protein
LTKYEQLIKIGTGVKETYILTTLSKNNYQEYSNITIESWKKYWPSDWKLILVGADTIDGLSADIILDCPEKDKWIADTEITPPRKPFPKGYLRDWKKFCHKAWAQIKAYEQLKTGYMIWMDADVIWKSTPPVNLVETELQNHFFSAYLGRDNFNHKHLGHHTTPETGIVLYDLDHPQAAHHFAHWKEIYLSNELFKYPGWSDDFIYGELRKDNFKCYKSLTENQLPSRYPLAINRLNVYFEHWMGGGKLLRADAGGNRLKEKLRLR